MVHRIVRRQTANDRSRGVRPSGEGLWRCQGKVGLDLGLPLTTLRQLSPFVSRLVPFQHPSPLLSFYLSQPVYRFHKSEHCVRYGTFSSAEVS